MLHGGIRGGGGSIGALPSTFNTIHPFDMIFGTYNKLPFYFQLTLFRQDFFGVPWPGRRGGGGSKAYLINFNRLHANMT